LLTSVTFKYVINQSLPKISYLTYMVSAHLIFRVVGGAYSMLISTFCFFQFLITGLSFATFAVSPILPQNRLQLSFTLLLTSVAFKFVVIQSLPKISYLTYMVSTTILKNTQATCRVSLKLPLLPCCSERMIFSSFLVQVTCNVKSRVALLNTPRLWWLHPIG
jgi:hypothetical protein